MSSNSTAISTIFSSGATDSGSNRTFMTKKPEIPQLSSLEVAKLITEDATNKIVHYNKEKIIAIFYDPALVFLNSLARDNSHLSNVFDDIIYTNYTFADFKDIIYGKDLSDLIVEIVTTIISDYGSCIGNKVKQLNRSHNSTRSGAKQKNQFPDLKYIQDTYNDPLYTGVFKHLTEIDRRRGTCSSSAQSMICLYDFIRGINNELNNVIDDYYCFFDEEIQSVISDIGDLVEVDTQESVFSCFRCLVSTIIYAEILVKNNQQEDAKVYLKTFIDTMQILSTLARNRGQIKNEDAKKILLDILQTLEDIEKSNISYKRHIHESMHNIIFDGQNISPRDVKQYRRSEIREKVSEVDDDELRRSLNFCIIKNTHVFFKKEYGNTLIDFLVSKYDSPHEIEEISYFLKDVDTKLWNLEDILLFVGTGMYQLSFVKELEKQHILFTKKIIASEDIENSVLYEISYDDFLFLSSIDFYEAKEVLETPDYNIKDYKRIMNECKNLQKIIPYMPVSEDLEELCSGIIPSSSYRRFIADLEEKIHQEDFEKATYLCNLFGDFPGKEAIENFHRLFKKVSNLEFNSQLEILEEIFSLPSSVQASFFTILDDKEFTLDKISDQIGGNENLANFFEYVEQYDGWDDTDTILELYFTESPSQDTTESHNIFISEVSETLASIESRNGKELRSTIESWDCHRRVLKWINNIGGYLSQPTMESFIDHLSHRRKFLDSSKDSEEVIVLRLKTLFTLVLFLNSKGIKVLKNPQPFFTICLSKDIDSELVGEIKLLLYHYNLPQGGYEDFLNSIFEALRHNDIEFIRNLLVTEEKEVNALCVKLGIDLSSEKFHVEATEKITLILDEIHETFSPAHTSSTRNRHAGYGSGSFTRLYRSMIQKLKIEKNEDPYEYLKRVSKVDWREIYSEHESLEARLKGVINASIKSSADIYDTIVQFHTNVIDTTKLHWEENLDFVSKYWETTIIDILHKHTRK